jgi:hypothetical protein
MYDIDTVWFALLSVRLGFVCRRVMSFSVLWSFRGYLKLRSLQG